ncbi:hypothetical protein V8G54_025197, partial [Vigna mungo]
TVKPSDVVPCNHHRRGSSPATAPTVEARRRPQIRDLAVLAIAGEIHDRKPRAEAAPVTLTATEVVAGRRVFFASPLLRARTRKCRASSLQPSTTTSRRRREPPSQEQQIFVGQPLSNHRGSSRRSHNNHHAKHPFLFPITLCSITRSFHFGLESHIHENLHVFSLKLLFYFQ